MAEDMEKGVKPNETEVEPKAKKAPTKKKDEKIVKNTIDFSPTLAEARDKTVVVGWGRMNPITIGHEKLANKIKDVAKKNRATPEIYLTHSQDAKKNPLSYNDKVALAQKAFGSAVKRTNAKTIIQVAQELQKKYNKMILVVGQDRVKEFETLLNKYNGKDFTFDSIEIVSAGDRDPDAEGVEGMSASKMRAAAVAGKKDDFISGLPKNLQRVGDDVYDMVRSGMKLAEELETEGLLDEATLSLADRRKRGITMRKYKAKISAARKRAMKRKPNQEMLMKRAEKRARNMIRDKIIGDSNKSYDDLGASQKSMIDKKVEKRKAAIKRIAKKLIPKMRAEDLDLDTSLEMFLEASVGQDPDIKDRKGTQPAVYHKGLSKSTKEKRDAHFKKGAKMDDDNPAAYKPAPGDATAKTKESEHTKKYKAMYGEELEEASMNDTKPKKRYHEARKKDGTVKLDRRFRAFRNAAKPIEEGPNLDAAQDEAKKERAALKREHEREIRAAKIADAQMREEIEFENDVELLSMIEEVSNEILESIELDESKTKTALQKKADKSGISYGVLKKVYDRGVAAWRTGHRPGTTPAQWGMARVNSFITGGKTRTTADADLAKGLRKEEVELEEGPFKGIGKMMMKKKLKKKADAQYDDYTRAKGDALRHQRSSNDIKKQKHDDMNAAGKTFAKTAKALRRLQREEVELEEKLNVSDGIEAWIKDFQDSDAPQFDGKSKEKRREMAIAAFYSAKKENVEEAYKGKASDFKYDMEMAIDNVGISQKAIKKILKKGKGYEVRLSSYMDKSTHEKIAKEIGATLVDYRKDSGMSVGIYEAIEEVELDSFLDLNEQFELAEASILDKAIAAIHKHVSGGADLGDIAFRVSRAAGVNMSGRELERAYIKKHGNPEDNKNTDPAALSRLKKKFGFKEEGGAGDFGTDKLTKKYKKDTPCEEIKEDAGTPAHHLGIKSNFKHMLKHAVKHVDYDMDGDVDVDDFKKTVPDEITGAEKKDLTKAAFKKYRDELKHTRKGVAFESVNEEFETLVEDKCDLVGMKQIKDFERFVDRMFEKFGIDFNFTKHFGERMSDGRNDPCITMKELANFITKIYKNQGKSLKGVAGAEAVIKDIQSDLNIPVAVKYDSRNDEFDVVMKTIMRKKDFKTPNKVIKY